MTDLPPDNQFGFRTGDRWDGAWSALQGFAQTSALQNQALVAIRRPENRENRIQLVKSGETRQQAWTA
jgi:hypothetical protein